MSTPFVHLHVHTQYSMLDGAIRLGDLLDKTQSYGMNAVAVTDHGAMYGALEFYTKPIRPESNLWSAVSSIFRRPIILFITRAQVIISI